MALKRECDCCHEQESHAESTMVQVELPYLKSYYNRDKKNVDLCQSCAEKLHQVVLGYVVPPCG